MSKVAADPSTAEWLDGNKLVEWMHENCDLDRLNALYPNYHRRFRSWHTPGVSASVYTADEIFTAIGSHISEIPDEFFIERNPQRYRGRIDAETKATCLADLEADPDQQITVIAARYGITDRTVRNWLKEKNDG